MNIPTERLLSEAADRLKFIKQYKMSGSESDMVNMETNLKKLRQKFSSLKEPDIPNELTKLFATVSHIMIEMLSCHPCDLNFTMNKATDFIYFSHQLQLSLFQENSSEGEPTGHYLLIYSFPADPFAYHVTPLLKSMIPEYSEDTNEDLSKVLEINLTIQKIFCEFCRPFVNGKFRSKERKNIAAIIPTFSINTRKRKRGAPDTSIDLENVKVSPCPVFQRLKELYSKSSLKPNKSAKLIATIHDLLLGYFPFRSTVKKEDWPGGIDYKNSIILISHEEKSGKDEKHNIFFFNMILYYNEMEFYLSIRPTFSDSEVFVRKIGEQLLPDYENENNLIENEKISNLSYWLYLIYVEFMKKVMNGSYCSMPASSNTSRNSSRCHSRDEPRLSDF